MDQNGQPLPDDQNHRSIQADNDALLAQAVAAAENIREMLAALRAAIPHEPNQELKNEMVQVLESSLVALSAAENDE